MKKFVAILAVGIVLFSCKKQGEGCEACSLEPEAGPCEALFTKYYFDQEENKCKEFTWGGCDGVVPFETLEDCKACNCD